MKERRELNYPHFPGIAGPTDMKKGGVERNFLRHIIFNLINLNNRWEKCKLLLKQ
tara:strand:- start:177 stop:341 length:165 start_codon:yes stop_codon:yes gene_type:complete